MPRPDFTKDTLDDEDCATGEPVPPEDTDDVVVADAIVWFDHAEHTVELPTDEEDEEEMVGVPKLFESSVGTTTALLHGKPDYYTECNRHDPSSDTGACRKIESEEFVHWMGRGVLGEVDGENRKVVHVRYDMHNREEHDGPCNGDMEFDAIIKGDDVVERRLAKKGDKVAANWEEDKSDIDMENQSGRTSPGYGIQSATIIPSDDQN
jgi:hypothetical protein